MPTVSDVVNKMNLGVSKKTIEGTADSPLQALLIGLHQEIIDRLNKSIDKWDARASNRLKQSMVTVDNSKDGVLSVGISAEFYWKYVNYGVNGTKFNRGAPTWGKAPSGTEPFKLAVQGWIRDRGITPKPKQTYKQLTFMIMKGIREKGQEARPFFTEVVNKELIAYLSKSISAVYKEAIRIEISEPWQ